MHAEHHGYIPALCSAVIKQANAERRKADHKCRKEKFKIYRQIYIFQRGIKYRRVWPGLNSNSKSCFHSWVRIRKKSFSNISEGSQIADVIGKYFSDQIANIRDHLDNL